MRNRVIIYCFVALLSGLIYSCKDKSAFTISGTLTNPGSLKKVFLLAADSNTVSVVDSTSISEGGKFQSCVEEL